MYQCSNPACNKVFPHTAKLVENQPVQNDPLGNTIMEYDKDYMQAALNTAYLHKKKKGPQWLKF